MHLSDDDKEDASKLKKMNASRDKVSMEMYPAGHQGKTLSDKAIHEERILEGMGSCACMSYYWRRER